MPRSTSAASSPPFFRTWPVLDLDRFGAGALKAPDAPPMQSALQDAVQPAMQNGDVCNAEREKESKREGGGSRRSPSRPVVGASYDTVQRDIRADRNLSPATAPRTVKSLDGVDRTFGRHDIAAAKVPNGPIAARLARAGLAILSEPDICPDRPRTYTGGTRTDSTSTRPTHFVSAPTRAAPLLTSTPGREHRCPGTGWLRSEPTARLCLVPCPDATIARAPFSAALARRLAHPRVGSTLTVLATRATRAPAHRSWALGESDRPSSDLPVYVGPRGDVERERVEPCERP